MKVLEKVRQIISDAFKRAARPIAGSLFVLLFATGCTTGVVGESWANFTVRDQYVYVAFKDVVFRVDTTRTDPTRSDEKYVDWAAQNSAKSNMYAQPAIAPDGKIILGAFDRDIYAFSPDASPRNTSITTFDTPLGTDKYIGAAAVSGDTFYIGTGDRGIKAFSVANGAIQPVQFGDTRFGVWATPIVDDELGLIYVAALDHNVYALNKSDFTIKWKYDTGGQLSGTPLLADHILYVGTFNSGLVAIDTRTGNVTDEFATSGWIWATPVLHEGNLYFGDLQGYVYSLKVEGLVQNWKQRDEEHAGGIRGSVAIAEGRVYVGSESKYVTAYALDTGAVVWRNSAPDKVLSDLVVVGQDVVFTTLNEDNLVVGMNIQTGQRSWKVTKPNQDKVNSLLVAPPTALPATTAQPTTQPTLQVPVATVESTSEPTLASTTEPTDATTAVTAVPTTEATPTSTDTVLSG